MGRKTEVKAAQPISTAAETLPFKPVAATVNRPIRRLPVRRSSSTVICALFYLGFNLQIIFRTLCVRK